MKQPFSTLVQEGVIYAILSGIFRSSLCRKRRLKITGAKILEQIRAISAISNLFEARTIAVIENKITVAIFANPPYELSLIDKKYTSEQLTSIDIKSLSSTWDLTSAKMQNSCITIPENIIDMFNESYRLWLKHYKIEGSPKILSKSSTECRENIDFNENSMFPSDQRNSLYVPQYDSMKLLTEWRMDGLQLDLASTNIHSFNELTILLLREANPYWLIDFLLWSKNPKKYAYGVSCVFDLRYTYPAVIQIGERQRIWNFILSSSLSS
jgi:hypothetical protein